MAKGTAAGVDRAKVKFRVIEFELEGGNSAVENSIRQFSHALTTRPNATFARAALAGSGEPVPTIEENPGVEMPESEELGPETSDSGEAPVRQRSPRRPTVPEPIEIDLTSGEMPFRQYCDERGIGATSSDSKKYLVAAVWLKEFRQIPAIEAGHIYSIFKIMKWNIPADIGAPLRGMKKQKWFTTPERGKFAVNHLGENEVNRMGS